MRVIPLFLQLLFAVLLDLLLGDPRGLPHPVQLIAFLGKTYERWFRKTRTSDRFAGILTVSALILTATLLLFILYSLMTAVSPLVWDIFSIYIIYASLAARGLSAHGMAVLRALEQGDIAGARIKVGMMCSRDTGSLDETGIVKACVESISENISDGVIAPLFFAVIGGPFGALLYKVTNTADSLFGYKNEKYFHFGWFAAKFDDVVNFLPARITGFLIAFSAFFSAEKGGRAFKIMLRDSRKHDSPNAGFPEAAAAGALGVRLGGPGTYFGEIVKKPYIGDPVKQIIPRHIGNTVKLFWVSYSIFVIASLGVCFFLGYCYQG